MRNQRGNLGEGILSGRKNKRVLLEERDEGTRIRL